MIQKLNSTQHFHYLFYKGWIKSCGNTAVMWYYSHSVCGAVNKLVQLFVMQSCSTDVQCKHLNKTGTTFMNQNWRVAQGRSAQDCYKFQQEHVMMWYCHIVQWGDEWKCFMKAEMPFRTTPNWKLYNSAHCVPLDVDNWWTARELSMDVAISYKTMLNILQF